MLVERTVTRLLRLRVVNRAARAAAHVRGHGLVLVYHRVGAPPPPDCEVLPTVPVDVFKAQIQSLGEVADLVALDEILAPAADRHSRGHGGRRPAVALTFDDDLPTHVTNVLPVLREMRVPAAFFLSGRALLGRGPYWFQQLEALLVKHGRARTAALLGAPSAGTSLALLCERNGSMRQKVSELSASVPEPQILTGEAIAKLSLAGMTIGFHTVEHDILPTLDDVALEAAVSYGRQRVESAVTTPVRFFSYPHGKADARSARAVREAGFDAAFTGRSQPLGPRVHRYMVGRWEPGPLSIDDLLVKLAVRLHRASPAAARIEVES
jgi:peptidoglycan/xylan/chitin deacetylase (PgdA/CDA1 family)